MADLRTTYLGLELASPLVASSSPLTGRLDSLLELEAAGAAAVVLPSLFEEEIGEEPSGPLALPTPYADLLAAAKESLSIPVIASLNGTTPGGWLRLAEFLQQGGADAIELNVYAVETDPYTSGAAIEDRTLRIVHRVKSTVSVPVAVKVSPYYSAFAHMADRLVDARADGIVLFNRFLQPDVDLESLAVTPHAAVDRDPARPRPGQPRCDGRRSHKRRRGQAPPRRGRRRLPRVRPLLEQGPDALRRLSASLHAWLDDHGYGSVAELRGSLVRSARGSGCLRAGAVHRHGRPRRLEEVGPTPGSRSQGSGPNSRSAQSGQNGCGSSTPTGTGKSASPPRRRRRRRPSRDRTRHP
jgi:dihydroorotate dehydrogenase (fumarate)